MTGMGKDFLKLIVGGLALVWVAVVIGAAGGLVMGVYQLVVAWLTRSAG